MKVSKKEIYIVRTYNKETRSFDRANVAFTNLHQALTWCKQTNKMYEENGLDEFYEAEWIPIYLFDKIEENEERES